MAEVDRIAYFSGQFLDLDFFTGIHPVLFSTSLYDRVHFSLLHNKMKFLKLINFNA
ncbi:hypothetical protein PITCH_A640083 [uncultured Desulfobacterium sp.]|uniref:Uncharacterized protein n=1 Tax=uncultured Desulfobacterium sp. TaxID=201089 RepID=A0A445N1G3_9BACT|nr:hypothetical protein PITCH_A640083 [uncultured Desulfobacterium sp.]